MDFKNNDRPNLEVIEKIHDTVYQNGSKFRFVIIDVLTTIESDTDEASTSFKCDANNPPTTERNLIAHHNFSLTLGGTEVEIRFQIVWIVPPHHFYSLDDISSGGNIAVHSWHEVDLF